MENEKEPKPSDVSKDDSVDIKIEKAGILGETISNKKFWSIFVAVFLCTCALLFGIFAVISTLKLTKQIPNIITKSSGVVINIEPDKEVAYFLLNSSDYWAETDIHVRKGDIISVFSSGTYNTAIHHIVNSADKDEVPPFKWCSMDGYPPENNAPRLIDRLSFEESIMPSSNNGTLVMKVASNREDDGDLYAIGKKQENVTIRDNGKLFFCVNEIYLDASKIVELQKKYFDNLVSSDNQIKALEDRADHLLASSDIDEQYKKFIDNNDYDGLLSIIYARTKTNYLSLEEAQKCSYMNEHSKKNYVESTVLKPWNAHKDSSYVEKLSTFYQNFKGFKSDKQILKSMLLDNAPIANGFINYRMGDKNEKVYTVRGDNRQLISRIIELEKYYQLDYPNVWYDDNLGSIFIIVEKKKNVQ